MMPAMLSIDEARAAVLAEVRALEAQEVAVDEALGRVLAEDVAAAADVPGFANSAMDGFAVRSGRPAGACASSARAAPAPPPPCPLATARRSASRRARCCPTAPTRSCSGARHRRGDEVVLEDDVVPGATCAIRARTSVPARR